MMKLINKGSPTHIKLCETAQAIVGRSTAFKLKLQRTLLWIGQADTPNLNAETIERVENIRADLTRQIKEAVANPSRLEKFRMFLEEELYLWKP